MKDLTAIILTKNEEKNIVECIKSIRELADRIVVVDSYSTDRTTELASEYGADIYKNPFINHAIQFNWALDNSNIQTKWILKLDADERLLPETVKEIEENLDLHKDDDINGFVLRFRVYFLGRWIKHGGSYPFRKLLIFKYGIGRIEERRMDEHTILSTGRSIEIKNDCLHYDFKDLNHWISKHNWYATKEMQEYFDSLEKEYTSGDISNEHIQKRRKNKVGLYYRTPMFIRPFLYFLYRYIIKRGFLDGTEGLIFHFLQAFWYRFIVDAKIYECLKTGTSYGETGDLKV